MTTIQIKPSALVRTGLTEMRRPLSWVEQLTRQQDGLAWPPALLFDSFEASAKRVIGALLRDDVLICEGKLQRASIGRLAETERLYAQALQKSLHDHEVLKVQLATR